MDIKSALDPRVNLSRIKTNPIYFLFKKPGPQGQVRDHRLCRNISIKNPGPEDPAFLCTMSCCRVRSPNGPSCRARSPNRPSCRARSPNGPSCRARSPNGPSCRARSPNGPNGEQAGFSTFRDRALHFRLDYFNS